MLIKDSGLSPEALESFLVKKQEVMGIVGIFLQTKKLLRASHATFGFPTNVIRLKICKKYSLQLIEDLRVRVVISMANTQVHLVI